MNTLASWLLMFRHVRYESVKENQLNLYFCHVHISFAKIAAASCFYHYVHYITNGFSKWVHLDSTSKILRSWLKISLIHPVCLLQHCHLFSVSSEGLASKRPQIILQAKLYFPLFCFLSPLSCLLPLFCHEWHNYMAGNWTRPI